MIFKSVCHFRQAHCPSGWSGWRSGSEIESERVAGLRCRCWLRRGVVRFGGGRRLRCSYGGQAGRLGGGSVATRGCRRFLRRRCRTGRGLLSSESDVLPPIARHGRQRLFVCENSERVERPRVLWIARHIFNLLPRARRMAANRGW